MIAGWKTRRAAPRRALALALLTAVGLTGPVTGQPARAQDTEQVKAGRDLAGTLCTACHRIGAADREATRTPPDFGAIADMPSMTGLSLNVFLRTPHGEMPRYLFSPAEMDALIAYIQSLRTR